jgi:biotin operon repressor
MPKKRGDTGQYVETVGPTDVLEVFDHVDGPPVVTSADVAEQTGLSRDSARRKLEELKQRGSVDSRRTAGRVLYWRTDNAETTKQITPQETREGRASNPSDRTASREKPMGTDSQSRSRDTRPAGLASVEFPDGRDRDQCEAAVLAARDYLREQGPATMRELVTEVMPEHPVGYDIPELEPGDRYRGAWWRRVVKPGLQALPDVQAPSRGASDWRFNPDNRL